MSLLSRARRALPSLSLLPRRTPTTTPTTTRSLLTVRDNRLWLDNNDAPISWLWLRDACACPRCIHPSTRQKLHKSTDIPSDVAPAAPLEIREDAVSIQWSETDAGPSHHSTYPLAWLRRHFSNDVTTQYYSPLHAGADLVYWNALQLSLSPSLSFSYSRLQSEPLALAEAINKLLCFGIVFVSDIPTFPTDNDAVDLPIKQLASLFSDIRHTFYGPVWDVKSVAESRNIAYTNLDLDLHMDLLYFQDPPKFQVLHCLRNRVDGGTSIFVDAFKAAYKLMDTDHAKFDILVNTLINFHYDNDGHFHHCAHPTIELESPSRIKHVNYSPPFQAPFPLDTSTELWSAMSTFTQLLDHPSARFNHNLQEGEAVLFDNRRVLHARTAFQRKRNRASDDLETARWLKGCYLEADPLLDRARMMTSR